MSSKLCPELAQFRAEIMQRGQELFDQQNLGNAFNEVLRNTNHVDQGLDENQEFIDEQQDEYNFLQEVEMMAGNNEKSNHNIFQEVQHSFAYQQPEQFDEVQEEEQIPSHNIPQGNHVSTQNKFNLTSFEGVVQQIGTGKIFETENEKLQWMSQNVGQKLPKKRIGETQQLKRNTKGKKKAELPFSFDDGEKLDRSVFQKKGKEIHVPYNEHKQLFQLPRSYDVNQANFQEPFQRGMKKVINQNTTEQPAIEIIDDYEPPQMENIEHVEEPIPRQSGGLFGGTYQPMNQTGVNINRQTIPIKELKVKMWQALSNRLPSTNTKEGIPFSQVTASLPQILQMPENRVKVSVQTCFVTLLHLANEENLRFLSMADESDFQIQREQSIDRLDMTAQQKSSYYKQM